MGYLQLANGIPDFKKCVISFWFRVPQESIDKAEAASEAAPLEPFAYVIPLLVMGEKGTGDIPYSAVETTTTFYNQTGYIAGGYGNIQTPPEDLGGHRARATYTYNPNAWIQEVTGKQPGTFFKLSVDGEAAPTDPAFIGIYVSDGKGELFVNFETNQKPSVSGYAFSIDGIAPGSVIGHGPRNYEGPIPSQPGPHDAYPIGKRVVEYDWIFTPGFNVGGEVVIEDTTGWQPWPVGDTITTEYTKSWREYSDIAISATGAIESALIEITPDHWHHVLISLELKTIATSGTGGDEATGPITPYVDSAAKLYMAVDDVNLTEWDLSDRWTEGDPNEVITAEAESVAGEGVRKDDDGNVLGNPSYSLADPEIKCSGEALGIPATAEYVASIYKVEMAELQFFTGVTLDPAKVKNRRVFIDRDGVPVPPLPKIDPENPDNTLPPPAAELLGKLPEIVLTSAANWSEGFNTGTLGMTVDVDGKPIRNPAGQFKPTGDIKTWAPDPSLHGPQDPAPPTPTIRLARKPVAVE